MRESGHPKSRFAESFRKIGEFLLNLFRGDFPVFLLFLAITFFFWWSQTMSQNYQTQVKIPVQIAGIPDDYRVEEPVVRQLTVFLDGKGTALRKTGRRLERNSIKADFGGFTTQRGHATLSTQRLRDSLYSMMPASVSVLKIEPDSLVLPYELQRSVVLPVVFNGSTESLNQFFPERFEFSPESICAKVLLTDTLPYSVVVDANNVTVASDTTVMTFNLRPIPGVLFDVDDVVMTVYAQQYTEKTLEVPIAGVNFPDNVTLKSFPSKAVLSAWVKLSEYDKVSESDFQVVVDYNDIALQETPKVLLRIYRQPANVRNVRLQTRAVDYLMESGAY